MFLLIFLQLQLSALVRHLNKTFSVNAHSLFVQQKQYILLVNQSLLLVIYLIIMVLKLWKHTAADINQSIYSSDQVWREKEAHWASSC